MSQQQHPIEPLIEQLKAANAQAVDSIRRNSEFNQGVQRSLEGINAQIRQIADAIRGLQGRLADSQLKLGENDTTIRENQEANRMLQQEFETVNRERQQTTAQLSELEKERIRIQEDAARQQRDNEARLTQLQQEKVDEVAALSNASAADRAKLQADLDATNAQIAELTQDNKNLADQSAQSLSELDAQRQQLQQELNDSKAEIQSIEAERSSLQASSSTLRAENTRLNQLLTEAMPQMQAAIDNLASLSNATGQAEINRIIEQINVQLTEINNLLEISGGPGAPGSEDFEFYGANPGPMNFSEEVIFNGRPQPIQQVMDFLTKKNNELIKQRKPDNKYKEALDFIKKSKTAKEIENYLGRNTLKGGRKTRKLRNKKTRKGRKTRKIRRRKTKKFQRGGYHYNQHARRRSITTTARRSSRRSSTRRTSSV
jgi:hypothetical protein